MCRLIHQRAELLKYLEHTDRRRYERVLERLASGLEPRTIQSELIVNRASHILGRLLPSFLTKPTHPPQQRPLRRGLSQRSLFSPAFELQEPPTLVTATLSGVLEESVRPSSGNMATPRIILITHHSSPRATRCAMHTDAQPHWRGIPNQGVE